MMVPPLKCMKFKSKTRMMTASWRDIEMAGAQGTITSIQFPGLEGNFQFTGPRSTTTLVYGGGLKQRMSDKVSIGVAWVSLFMSSLLFGASSYHLYKTAKDELYSLKEPMVRFEEDGVVA